MAITSSELSYEKRKLSETDSWLKKQIEDMEHSDKDLKKLKH